MRPVRDVVATIGQTVGRQPQRTFGIGTNDRLNHIAMFGQTGTGKSSLLAGLMQQDVENDVGFGLLDPHGDLAQAVRAVAGSDCIY